MEPIRIEARCFASPRVRQPLRALVTVTLEVYNGPSGVRIYACLSSRLRVRKDYGE